MAQTSWIGQTLNNRYEIQDMLGQGGMSAVYKALDPNLRRVVAIKLIHQHLTANPEFVRRFEEEAAAVALLRHPNLIQVYDFTHDGDTYYIVFEFVPGETLQDRMKRFNSNGRNFEIPEVVSAISKTADGLHFAHNKGLIHRDIKPANIMMNVTSDPIVMDFGIAKIMGGTQHTATGAVLGTARYMSPEQIKGERVDVRTDIYSLGVVLYEMLGGRPPFEADSAMALMMMHMTDTVPDLAEVRPDLPADIVAVVNKSLSKDRADRFQTAAEMSAALNHVGSAPVVRSGATTHETPVILPADQTIVESPTGRSATVQPVVEPTPVIAPPPDATILDSSAQQIPVLNPVTTSSTGTGGAAAVSPPTPQPAPTPVAKQGNQRMMMMAGGAVLLLLIAFLAFKAFSGGGDGGEEQANGGEVAETAVIAAIKDTPEPEETATDTPDTEPEATNTAAPEPTNPEPAIEIPSLTTGAVTGNVAMKTGQGDVQITGDTPLQDGSQIISAAESDINFISADASIFQLEENGTLNLVSIAEDQTSTTQETIFKLEKGDFLLRKLGPGNTLILLDANDEIVGSLEFDEIGGDEGVLAISVNDQGTRISCFAGICSRAGGPPTVEGREILLSPTGEILDRRPITAQSGSYIFWQEACSNCLPEIAGPPTAVPPTAAPTAIPPTAAPAPEFFVRISGIALEGDRYVVSYATSGYTEQLPGMHVHFYFDTVPESNAGSPGSGPWKLYAGGSPFTGYSVGERGGASAMCARVANANHSIISGSGNCVTLP